jgi:hypothetical protein
LVGGEKGKCLERERERRRQTPGWEEEDDAE